MFRLGMLIYAMAGTTLAGMMIIVALVTGYDTAKYVITAAAIGGALGLPVAYLVSKAIQQRG